MAEPRDPTRGDAPLVPAPRVILFDLDDTLCDYAGARATRLRLAFATERHPAFATLPSEARERLLAEAIATSSHGVDHFPEMLDRHGIADRAAAEAAAGWYRSNRYHGLRLFPDVVATLRALRHASVGQRPIGIITNGPADVQRPKIDLLDVEPLVDFIVISGEFGASKPDPAIFREALRLADASHEAAVFIGDSPEFDIAGAQAAGIRSIWMNRVGRDWVASDPPPDRRVGSLAELVALLGG